MKRIYMTAALLGALVTGAFAQKSVDLQIVRLFPEMNASYANPVAGDEIPVACLVKNLGTAAVVPTDTIQFNVGSVASDNSASYEIYTKRGGLSIAAGAQDTLVIFFEQGASYGAGNDGDVIVKFKTNARDTVYAYAFGWEQNGTGFNDPGYIAATDSLVLTGNNFDVWSFTFGTTGIDFVSDLDKENLNVYPNPANNEINYTYNFVSNSANNSIRVTDIIGRVVINKDLGKQTVGEKSFKLDVSSLTNGVYYVELVTDSKRAVSKLSIKK